MDATGNRARGWIVRGIGVALAAYVAVVLALMWWWDYEPPHFDVAKAAQERAAAKKQAVVTGSVTTSALLTIAQTLLDKRGGYLQQRQVPARRADGQRAELGIRRADRDA